MRKTLCALLVMGMIFAGFAGMASANTSETISVTINGEKQTYSVSPILRNNSVLVPLRAIFESLGSYLTYDPETQEITASKGNTQIYLQVGNNIAKVNDQTVKLDQPAIVLSGSTYVPVRFVSEALGAKVDWDPKTRTVIIEYVDIYMIDAALREDNLDKFAALIKRSGDPALGNDAISLALNHQKGVPWISAALEAGAPVWRRKGDLLLYGLGPAGTRNKGETDPICLYACRQIDHSRDHAKPGNADREVRRQPGSAYPGPKRPPSAAGQIYGKADSRRRPDQSRSQRIDMNAAVVQPISLPRRRVHFGAAARPESYFSAHRASCRRTCSRISFGSRISASGPYWNSQCRNSLS